MRYLPSMWESEVPGMKIDLLCKANKPVKLQLDWGQLRNSVQG